MNASEEARGKTQVRGSHGRHAPSLSIRKVPVLRDAATPAVSLETRLRPVPVSSGPSRLIFSIIHQSFPLFHFCVRRRLHACSFLLPCSLGALLTAELACSPPVISFTIASVCREFALIRFNYSNSRFCNDGFLCAASQNVRIFM